MLKVLDRHCIRKTRWQTYRRTKVSDKEGKSHVQNLSSSYSHGIVHACEKLHHELRIQHYPAADFLPLLLVLPRKPTHTNPGRQSLRMVSWLADHRLNSSPFSYRCLINARVVNCRTCLIFNFLKHAVIHKACIS